MGTFEFGVLTLCNSLQPFVLQRQRAVLQRVVNDQQNFRIVPRLRDVAINLAPVDRVNGGGDVGIAGQQQPHRIGPALAYLLQKMDTIHFRHAHVRNDQVNGDLLQQFQRCFSPHGKVDLVALGAKQAFK